MVNLWFETLKNSTASQSWEFEVVTGTEMEALTWFPGSTVELKRTAVVFFKEDVNTYPWITRIFPELFWTIFIFVPTVHADT
jgi:hypothetical protein